MLTQIRHIQKGALIIVTIVVVIAFAFLYADFDFVSGTVGRQDCVVKVYDRCYRQKEAAQLATNFDVAYRLGMYEFATVMFGENRRDDDRTDFIMSLVILRKEAEKLGIEPTSREIKEAIPDLPIFQQPWVNADFLKNNILGPSGFTDGDLAQLVKDYLSYQKLRDLVGSGVAAVPSEVGRVYTRANQRYDASLISFDREAFVDEIEITDDMVQEYYETNQAGLQSEQKRGFEYVKFLPKELPEEATNEERANAVHAFSNAVNRAYSDLADDESDFAEIARRYEGEKADFTMSYARVEPFAASSPPEELAGKPDVLAELFSRLLREDEVTVPVSTGEGGGYYVFHLTELVEPQPLTLEEAEPRIRETLLRRESDRAVNDAASEARVAITEALEAGKSFEEATAAAGVEASELPNFSRREPPAPEEVPEASQVVAAIEGVGEGEISEVVRQSDGDGYLLVHVDQIQLYEDENRESAERSIAAALENEMKRRLFSAWFNQRRMESSSARALGTTTMPVEEPAS